jgi:tetratricopeptide (TPR) repeat protein
MQALAPLYAAVAHGCLAGRVQEALHVLRQRIRRCAQQFSLEQLGAFGIELATVAHAFTVPWSSLVPGLSSDDQLFLLYTAGECLNALGRVHEATAPLQQALACAYQQQHWTTAALATTKLSEVARAQGDLTASLRFAEQSTLYARRPGVPRQVQILSHAFYGFALYWVGHTSAAQAAFQEAEQVQYMETPERPILHAVLGYMYSELLLDQLASQATHCAPEQLQEAWHALCTRLTQALTFAHQDGSPRDMGLQHTSMGRLYTLAWQHARALGLCPALAQEHAATHFTQAITCLRVSNYHNYFPRALLSQAALFRVQGLFAMAHANVDAVLALARSSVMDVYQAEASLEKASLFLAAYEADPQAHQVYQAVASLETAKTMIDTMGYYRRSHQVEELEARLRLLVSCHKQPDI